MSDVLHTKIYEWCIGHYNIWVMYCTLRYMSDVLHTMIYEWCIAH